MSNGGYCLIAAGIVSIAAILNESGSDTEKRETEAVVDHSPAEGSDAPVKKNSNKPK